MRRQIRSPRKFAVTIVLATLLNAALTASWQARLPLLASSEQTATATRTPTPVNFGNFVWDDIDQDGRQDAGEPGLSGITVQLWNSTKTDLIDSDITDLNGNYSVQSSGPGAYRLRFILSNGADQFTTKDQISIDDLSDSDVFTTGPNSGFTDIYNVASNVISISSIDAGIIKFRTPTPTRTPTPINIGNFVWDDVDQDGVQDAGEPGVPGVTVQLWNADKTQVLASDVTDANGNYTVIAPVPGNYRIRVVLPWAGAYFSPKGIGSDALKDSDINPAGIDFGFSDIFNLASNVISTTQYDIGLIEPVAPTPTPTVGPFSIGDFIWHDLNNDGAQDNREPGLYAIRVQLWNAA